MKQDHFYSILVITVLIPLTLLVSGCSAWQPVREQGESMPAVKIFQIGSDSSSIFKIKGKVVPAQEVQVVSKIPGKVAAVNVSEGAKVKKGDELVKLEDDDYFLQFKQAESALAAAKAKLADVKTGTRYQEIQALEGAVEQALASVEQTKAAVEQAKSAYDFAQKHYSRMKNLFDHSAVSQAELDQATLDLEKARTSYEQAQAQLKAMYGQLASAQAKLDLAKSGPTSHTIKALEADVSRLQHSLELAQHTLHNISVKAPIDGIVSKRNIEPGEMAQPGVPLLTLVKMDQVQIEVSVPQKQVNHVKNGATVEVRVDGINDTFKGTVEFISPVSDPNNSTFPVKVKVDNAEGLLRAGMVAEISFIRSLDGYVEIPKSAIINKDNKTFVYKYENGVVHLVEVKTKEKNKDWVYVVRGLQRNEQIVVYPSDALKDGSKVRAN
ncbi:efflux RND transporter periplasmic adaptor subunit [Bacillaceae bacterium]